MSEEYRDHYDKYVEICNEMQVEPITYEKFAECQAYLVGALK